MSQIEQVRFGLFLGAVVLVFFLAAGILVRFALRRLGLITLSTTRAAIWSRRAILGLAGSGLLCIAYGLLVEPYWPEVTHVAIASPKLPPGSRPIRIVHLSDIHSDPAPRLEGRLPGLVLEQRPDLIVFTGDALNDPAGLPIFRGLMTGLARRAPTFAVRGNWDVWYWSDLDLFGGTGVREIDAEAVRVDVRGTPIWIAGVPVDSEARIGEALASVPRGDLSVFLHHYPDEIERVSAIGPDLYCAGHIHGGQIALPFYGALITLSRYGKRFEAGLYRVGPTHLYVNRGIGMEGGRMPRVRFCARPEITVIEVRPADDTAVGRSS